MLVASTEDSIDDSASQLEGAVRAMLNPLP